MLESRDFLTIAPSERAQIVSVIVPLGILLTSRQSLLQQETSDECRPMLIHILGALLLLIDECKILIHSAAVVRQYVRLMITDTFGRLSH